MDVSSNTTLRLSTLMKSLRAGRDGKRAEAKGCSTFEYSIIRLRAAGSLEPALAEAFMSMSDSRMLAWDSMLCMDR